MQTIGERLEEARKKKGISIREAAEATKIRGDYLSKFESNHFDIGLTEIYTRGFLRTYANFLKLPADRILNDYAALGRGDVRPRQPAREVYGRMDITVASAEKPADTAAAPAESNAAPEPSPANRGPQRSRATNALPTGPDPALVFKYIKWGGIAVIALLALLLIWSLIGNNKRAAATSTTNQPAATPSASAARVPQVTLIALRPVQIRVTKALPDNVTDGEEIFSATLAAGETRSVPRLGAIFIDASPPANLEVEYNGNRRNWGQALAAYPGLTRGMISAPAATP